MRILRKKKWYYAGNRYAAASSANGRRRKYYGQNKNIKISGMNLAVIIVIIGAAVLCGFITTRCVIYPLILGEEASFNMDFNAKEWFFKEDHAQKSSESDDYDKNSGDDAEDIYSTNDAETSIISAEPNIDVNPVTAQARITENEKAILTSGYCIQYGCFSSESAAMKLIEELEASGLTARMVKQDDKYKVVGQIFSTREEAADAQKAVIEYGAPEYRDVFITCV